MFFTEHPGRQHVPVTESFSSKPLTALLQMFKKRKKLSLTQTHTQTHTHTHTHTHSHTHKIAPSSKMRLCYSTE